MKIVMGIIGFIVIVAIMAPGLSFIHDQLNPKDGQKASSADLYRYTNDSSREISNIEPISTLNGVDSSPLSTISPSPEPDSLSSSPTNTTDTTISTTDTTTDMTNTANTSSIRGTSLNIDQVNAVLIKAQQETVTRMKACVDQKNQLFNQLVVLDRQRDQLQRQIDALNNAFSRTNDSKRIDQLNRQMDILQDKLDDVNDAMSDTQGKLDDLIGDCRDDISDLRSKIDELEADIDTAFNDLLNYQLPN